MADIALTPRKVKADPSALCLPYDAGGSGSVGDWVYLASDGDVEQTDADVSASAQGIGIVVAVGTMGATTFVAGDRLSVCVFGLCEIAPTASLTIPGRLYASTTAGAADQTAPASSGDFPFILGRAVSTSAVFVNPQTGIPVVNS